MNQKKEKAILMVSFGSSHLDTLEKNIAKMEQEAQERFSEYQVYRAFTSRMILQKLRETQHLCIDTVEAALERMLEDGIKEVVVQPTHIINGTENDAMLRDLKRYETQFAKLRIGKPLLSKPQDYKKAVQAVMEQINLEEDEMLILMGHGTEHHANAAYCALEYMFHYLGYEQVLVGTVEGFPGLGEVMTKLEYTGKRRVRLLPFMFVAGEHAKEDMAGEDASWKSEMEQAGYRVEAQIQGLGELQGIRQIYMEHIRAVL